MNLLQLSFGNLGNPGRNAHKLLWIEREENGTDVPELWIIRVSQNGCSAILGAGRTCLSLRGGWAHGMGAVSGGEQQGSSGSGCGSSTYDQGSLFGHVKAVAAGCSAFGLFVASGLV